ncbi:CLUMA_CG018599, isoform A [Clunio marinus]|uniref:CLUMA_CG018599, isoform A n=1 Tax=Clunio marinus TaxID=568069 RepID=A0A1J1IYA0_9DIPT|nr:CLUMA_CG018599, isoform A [Clunio marinus]
MSAKIKTCLILYYLSLQIRTPWIQSLSVEIYLDFKPQIIIVDHQPNDIKVRSFLLLFAVRANESVLTSKLYKHA